MYCFAGSVLNITIETRNMSAKIGDIDRTGRQANHGPIATKPGRPLSMLGLVASDFETGQHSTKKLYWSKIDLRFNEVVCWQASLQG